MQVLITGSAAHVLLVILYVLWIAKHSNPVLTTNVELQLAKIYNPLPSKSSLRIKIVPVQQQEGFHDLAKKPEAAQFDQNSMRQHLIKCLNEKHLERFPMSKHTETLPRATPRVKNISICHMPESFDDKMISCDNCRDWYHCSCVLSYNSEPETWKCFKCIEKQLFFYIIIHVSEPLVTLWC